MAVHSEYMYNIYVIIISMATLFSWNVNGLRNVEKIDNVLSIAKENRVDFFVLQETFWDDSSIQTVRKKWEGDIFYSNYGDKCRRGVAVLVNLKFKEITKQLYRDEQGRILKLRVEHDFEPFDLITIYAPNNDKERIELIQEVENNIDPDIPFFIVGDFNIIQSPIDRSETIRFTSDRSRNSLFGIYNKYNCLDVWRYRNAQKRVFSRKQYVEGILKQSRIDYMVASRCLLKDIQTIYYRHSTMSDHNILCMKFDIDKVEKGPGIWIHNNKLLEEEEYCKKIIDIIEKQKKCPLFNNNITVWWDNLKFKFKQFSKLYGKNRARQHNEHYWRLQRNIENESRRASNNTDYDVSKLKTLESELQQIEEEKCKGAVIRSKATWALEGERNTKYFLELEQHRQKSNSIKELVKSDGQIVRHTDDILTEEFKFYSSLYKRENIDYDEQKSYIEVLEKTIDEEKRLDCDKPIETTEMTEAVQSMSINKSPGSDGLTTKFYLKFWKEIQPLLFQVFTQIFENDKMTRSMKKGIITLIYKQKGDRNQMKNYRPISLLNVDYKILTRIFANRLKQVIGSIINENQTCCVPNRDISDTISSIRDIIDYCSIENIECYIMKIDQEKAFDKIDHQYILEVVRKFGFGENFVKWISIFYKDIISSVKCNGHLTPFFNVERSVRQGCPLSAMLYVLAVEPLAMSLIKHNEIQGIPIPKSEITSLAYQHADDTTVTVSNKLSIGKVFDVFDKFCQVSGSKINMKKSEIFVIGTQITNKDIRDVKISSETLEILGVHLGTNSESVDMLNWKQKIGKMKTIINLWKRRKLTLIGRATVISSLLTSRVWYTLMVQTIPEWALNEIKTICLDFLWNGKKHQISFETIRMKSKEGGLGIPDVLQKRNAFRMKYVAKCLSNDVDCVWKHVMMYFLSKYKQLNLNREVFFMKMDSREFKKFSKYYRELLIAFNNIYSHIVVDPGTKEDILKQPLFENHNFDVEIPKKIAEIFQNAGIITMSDIVYEVIPGYFPEQAIIDAIQEKHPEMTVVKIAEYYAKLLQSIPIHWTESVNKCKYANSPQGCIYLEIDEKFKNIEYCRSSDFYTVLLKKNAHVPVSYIFWESKLRHHNHSEIWRNIFYRLKMPTWIENDFKIGHNTIFTMEKLNKIGLTDTNICQKCNQSKEDTMHMLIYCQESYEFVSYIRNIIHNLLYKLNTKEFNNLNFENIFLFGIRSKYVGINCNIINLILSCARYTICISRNIRLYHEQFIDQIRFFSNSFRKYVKQTMSYFDNRNEREQFYRTFIENNEYISIENGQLIIDI